MAASLALRRLMATRQLNAFRPRPPPPSRPVQLSASRRPLHSSPAHLADSQPMSSSSSSTDEAWYLRPPTEANDVNWLEAIRQALTQPRPSSSSSSSSSPDPTLLAPDRIPIDRQLTPSTDPSKPDYAAFGIAPEVGREMETSVREFRARKAKARDAAFEAARGSQSAEWLRQANANPSDPELHIETQRERWREKKVKMRHEALAIPWVERRNLYLDADDIVNALLDQRPHRRSGYEFFCAGLPESDSGVKESVRDVSRERKRLWDELGPQGHKRYKSAATAEHHRALSTFFAGVLEAETRRRSLRPTFEERAGANEALAMERDAKLLRDVAIKLCLVPRKPKVVRAYDIWRREGAEAVSVPGGRDMVQALSQEHSRLWKALGEEGREVWRAHAREINSTQAAEYKLALRRASMTFSRERNGQIATFLRGQSVRRRVLSSVGARASTTSTIPSSRFAPLVHLPATPPREDDVERRYAALKLWNKFVRAFRERNPITLERYAGLEASRARSREFEYCKVTCREAAVEWRRLKEFALVKESELEKGGEAIRAEREKAGGKD